MTSSSRYCPAWLPLIATVAIAVVATIIPELCAPGFYYWDDNMHLFLPTMYEIGASLRSGHMPWITDRTWFGGNLVGEGQFALFNPVSLALYAVISLFDNAAHASLLFAGFYLCLTSAGVYLLARSLDVSEKMSVVAATAFCCTNQISYWYAAGWWNALVADAWLVLAIAFWVRYLRKNEGYFAATLCGALSMLSGWPHGWIALQTTVVLIAVAAWRSNDKDKAWRIAIGGVLSLIAALPGIVPTAIYVFKSHRTSAILSYGDMIGTIEALTMGFLPSLRSVTQRLYGWVPELPQYYSVWFAVPTLLLMSRKWRSCISPQRRFLLLAPLVVFALLSLSPQWFLFLRWSVRFLPYFNLFLILGAVVLIDRDFPPGDLPSNRSVIFLGVFGLYYSFVNATNDLPVHLEFCSIWLASMLCLVALKRQGKDASSFLVITTLSVLCLTHWEWPRNENVANWDGPMNVNPGIFNFANRVPYAGNTLLVIKSNAIRLRPGELRSPLETAILSRKDAPTGAMPLWSINATLNGYSALPHRGLQDAFCFTNAGLSHCADQLGRIFEPNPETGIRIDRLFRIKEIRITNAKPDNGLARAVPRDWERVMLDDDVQIFRAPAESSNRQVGTVAYAEQGLAVESIEAAVQHEVLSVTNPTDTAKRLVFSRPIYPGYRATLNGVTLPVTVTSDVFVSVTIPPRARGQLELGFMPPYIIVSAFAAMIALILAAFVGHSNDQFH